MSRKGEVIVLLLIVLFLAAALIVGDESAPPDEYPIYHTTDRVFWLNPATDRIEQGAAGLWGLPTADPVPGPDDFDALKDGGQRCGLAYNGDVDTRLLYVCQCGLGLVASCAATFIGNPPLEKCTRAWVVVHGAAERNGMVCVEGRDSVADPRGDKGWHWRPRVVR